MKTSVYKRIIYYIRRYTEPEELETSLKAQFVSTFLKYIVNVIACIFSSIPSIL